MYKIIILTLMILSTSCMQSLAPKDNAGGASSYSGCVSATPLDTSKIQVAFDFPSGASEVIVHRDGVRVYKSTNKSILSFIDSSLQEGQQYFYTCEAVFNGKPVYGSNNVDAYTNSINAPIFSGITTSIQNGPDSVLVSWQTPNGGALVSTYKIYGNPGTVLDWNGTPLAIVNQGRFSSTLTNLGDELPYVFGVRACSSNNLCDTNTLTASVTLGDTGAAKTIGASAASVVNGNINLTLPWDHTKGGVLKRHVYFNTSGGTNLATYTLVQSLFSINLSSPAKTFTYLSPSENTTYYFMVVDEDPSGNVISTPNMVTVTTGDLTAPTFTGISSVALGTNVETSIKIGWNSIIRETDNPSTGANEYLIYQTSIAGTATPPNPCSSGTLIHTMSNVPYSVLNTAITYDVVNLLPRYNYAFCVKAKDSSGNISNTTVYQTLNTHDITTPLFDGIQNIVFDVPNALMSISWNGSISNDIKEYKVRVWKNTTTPTPGQITTFTKSHASFSTGFTFTKTDFSFTDTDTVYAVVDACDDAAPSFGTQNCTNFTLAQAKLVLIPDATPPASFIGIDSTNTQSLTEGMMTVSWFAPVSWVDYRGFNVYTTDPNNSYALTLVKTCYCAQADCSDNLTSCNVIGLNPYRTYLFHVRAFDTVGNETKYLNPQFGNASKRVKDASAPFFNSNITSVIQGGNVDLSWGTASDNQYPSEPGVQISYRVYRKLNSNFATLTNPSFDGTLLTTINTFSYSDPLAALVEGATYYYAVCAIDSSNNEKCDGNFRQETVSDITPPTIGSLAIALDNTNTTLDKKWNLTWTMSDNNSLNGNMLVKVYRKFSNSNTDFPTAIQTGNIIYSALGIVSYGPDSNLDNPLKLEFVNYMIQVIDQAGNKVEGTISYNSGYVTQLVAYYGGFCALTNNGKVKCWGNNDKGQIGTGFPGNIGRYEKPSDINFINFSEKVTQLASGQSHVCALFVSGNIKCWGKNNFGQLGTADIVSAGHGVRASDRPNVNIGANTATAIFAGADKTCAILLNGELLCWGYQYWGGFGLGSPFGGGYNIGDNEAIYPNGVVNLSGKTPIKVSVTTFNMCIVFSDNTISCTGSNTYGQIGISSTINQSTLVPAFNPSDINNPSPVIDIETAGYVNCATLQNGKIKCWGANSGRLGTASTAHIGDNELPNSLPDFEFEPGVKVLNVSSNGQQTCAVLENGNLYCWGIQSILLARGITPYVDIGDDELASTNQINLGGTFAHDTIVGLYHACALLSNGEVRCWGANSGNVSNGSLGLAAWIFIGDNETPSNPAWSTEIFSNTIVNIAPYFLHTRQEEVVIQNIAKNIQIEKALDIDGSDLTYSISVAPSNGTLTNCLGATTDLSCTYTPDPSFTGIDQFIYQVSDGKGGTDTKTVNIQVKLAAGLTTYPIKIVGNYLNRCAIFNDQTVKCWGHNPFGSLGAGPLNSIIDISLTSTVNLGAGVLVKDIAFGGLSFCAVTTTDTVLCWGYNHRGQLGHGVVNLAVTNTQTPDLNPLVKLLNPGNPVAGDHVGETISKIAGGNSAYCVLFSLGGVRCWGYGLYGQLGYGNTLDVGDNEDPYTVGDLNLGDTATDLVGGGAGAFFCALLTTSGKPKCWGYNGAFKLGHADAPVNQSFGDNEAINLLGEVDILNPGESVIEMKANSNNVCVLIAKAATLNKVRCWGRDVEGQLADSGTWHDYRIADKAKDIIFPVGAGYEPVQLTVGGNTSCARFVNGKVRCWGNNITGGLGLGTLNRITVGLNDFRVADSSDIDLPETIEFLFESDRVKCVRDITKSTYCWGLGNYNSKYFNGYPRTSRGSEDYYQDGASDSPASLGRIKFFP